MWIIDYWAPWLGQHHPNPALPGEIRWFAVIDGQDVEVATEHPIEHKNARGRWKSSSRSPGPSSRRVFRTTRT